MTTRSAETKRLQVWSADLEVLSAALERVESRARLLAPTELNWTGTGTGGLRRFRRLARIALRVLLHLAGSIEARGCELAADANGKPRLGSGKLHFSVSHCQGFALIAIASVGPLGIDVEMDRQVQLGPQRQAMIVTAARSMLDGDASAIPFLDAWTCLEAFAKARGNGIGAVLTELGITVSGLRSISNNEVAAQFGDRAAGLLSSSGLRVAGLPLPPGLHGAICAPPELLSTTIRVRALQDDDCSLVGEPVTAREP